MLIVNISGHAQNGKDTVARLIKEQLDKNGKTSIILHYADLLKFICKSYFGWDGEKDEHGRQLLQYVGTNIIRNKRPDFWVDFVSDILELLEEPWDIVIIPDTRFPNEIDKLKERGFDNVHIRVTRSEFDDILTDEQKRHPSETALDDIKADFYIENDGSLEDLRKKVQTWIEENIYA